MLNIDYRNGGSNVTASFMNGMGTGMGGPQGTCWLVWMSPINMTCFKENYIWNRCICFSSLNNAPLPMTLSWPKSVSHTNNVSPIRPICYSGSCSRKPIEQPHNNGLLIGIPSSWCMWWIEIIESPTKSSTNPNFRNFCQKSLQIFVWFIFL